MDAASKKEAKMIGFAMLGGLVIGLILYFAGLADYANYLKPIGTIFMSSLKMVIVPLVMAPKNAAPIASDKK